MFVWVLAGGRIFVTSIVDSAIMYQSIQLKESRWLAELINIK
jgi:hypothetical protein